MKYCLSQFLIAVVILTLAVGCATTQSQLMLAAWAGKTDTVEALLAEGAAVNAKDSQGKTALMVVSEKGRTDIVKVLIAEGADTEVQDVIGNTALIYASSRGHAETVKALIEGGADTEKKGFEGTTALIVASMNGHTDTVKLLIAEGADVNAKSNDSRLTALWLAKSNGHKEIVDLLQEAGALEGKREVKNFSLDVTLDKGWKTTIDPESQAVTFADFEKGFNRQQRILVREIDALEIFRGSHSEKWVADEYRRGEEADMIERGVKKGMYELKDLKKFELEVDGKHLYAMTYRQLLKGLIGHGYLYLYFPDFKDSNKFYIFLYYYICPEEESQEASIEEFYSLIKGFKLKRDL